MTALEFAIEHTFRNFFFSLRLVLGWLVVLSPLLIATYVVAFAKGPPDFAHVPSATLGLFIALGIAGFLASLSVCVNWHRRILLKETPKRLGWIRLNGAVWRYLAAFLLIVIIEGAIATVVFAALNYLPPLLLPRLGPAAATIANGLAGLLALVALLVWYRLTTRLPAIATGIRGFKSWRATGGNFWTFLGFTFWLVFSLAIAGAMGTGAFMGQQMLGNQWVTAAAFVFIGLLAWLSLFLLATVPTCLFHFLGGVEEVE